MAMSAGTVTVDDNGTASGGGMARAIYDVQVARNITPYAGQIAGSSLVTAKKALANNANDLASAIVSHIVANAKAEITHATVVGVTPNPNNPDTNIHGPLLLTELAIV